MKRTTVRFLLAACCAVALVLMAGTPVTAQYRPLNTSSGQQASPVKGEKYHIEISGNLWDPAPDFTFSSEGLGIIGTVIDLDADLALEKKQMWEARLVLRPGKKHKLRAHYLPMQYTGDTILKKDIVFNGIKYPLAVAVKTDFKWTAWRFTYEYDIIYRPRVRRHPAGVQVRRHQSEPGEPHLQRVRHGQGANPRWRPGRTRLSPVILVDHGRGHVFQAA